MMTVIFRSDEELILETPENALVESGMGLQRRRAFVYEDANLMEETQLRRRAFRDDRQVFATRKSIVRGFGDDLLP